MASIASIIFGDVRMIYSEARVVVAVVVAIGSIGGGEGDDAWRSGAAEGGDRGEMKERPDQKIFDTNTESKS